MFLYGDRDSFALYARNLIEALPDAVPGLRATIALPGCGHWLQQERPEEATKLLANFLNDLGSRQRREA
jgi:pimeloyl-ACP methyl ester carboxylesterase